MTRQRKVDPEVLEREYIYDSGNPPISYTGLAAKYGLARNTVAEKAIRGRWFERREEFRASLGMKVTEKLGEEWVRFETAAREKSMQVGLKIITKVEEMLDSGELKPTVRDMIAAASMVRQLAVDATAARVNGEEVLLDENAPLDRDTALRVLAAIEQDERARLDAGNGSSGAPPAAGAPDAGED